MADSQSLSTEVPSHIITCVFQENIRIKVCNLAWNGFGPEGGVALADAIVSNEALTELDVSGNRIDSYACELIGKAVARNELIKVLKVSR